MRWGCGDGCWGGGAKVHGVYECNGENFMLGGVIPTGCIFMSSVLCITVQGSQWDCTGTNLWGYISSTGGRHELTDSEVEVGWGESREME